MQSAAGRFRPVRPHARARVPRPVRGGGLHRAGKGHPMQNIRNLGRTPGTGQPASGRRTLHHTAGGSAARGRARTVLVAMLLALLGATAMPSIAAAKLTSVGPRSAATGFPEFYGDGKVNLTICETGPGCAMAPMALGAPDGESFYFMADAEVGPVAVSNHLEGAYFTDAVDQEQTFM